MKQTYEIIKSPIKYVGNKYKLLPQILPLFPDKINTFIDVFGGSGCVSGNVASNKVIYNDKLYPLVEVLCVFKKLTSEQLHLRFCDLINEYKLRGDDVYSFNRLRSDYNLNPTWDKFFLLTVYCYNSKIEFNNEGKFNSSFGNRDYNISIQNNLKRFVDRLHKINIEFQNTDFRKINIDISRMSKDDLLYFDPPYIITDASYVKYWTKRDDTELLEILDGLTKLNIKFALSNVFENKGLHNSQLINWAKRYNVYYLNNDYSNCNPSRYDRDKVTVEVLITNY